MRLAASACLRRSRLDPSRAEVDRSRRSSQTRHFTYTHEVPCSWWTTGLRAQGAHPSLLRLPRSQGRPWARALRHPETQPRPQPLAGPTPGLLPLVLLLANRVSGALGSYPVQAVRAATLACPGRTLVGEGCAFPRDPARLSPGRHSSEPKLTSPPYSAPLRRLGPRRRNRAIAMQKCTNQIQNHAPLVTSSPLPRHQPHHPLPALPSPAPSPSTPHLTLNTSAATRSSSTRSPPTYPCTP